MISKLRSLFLLPAFIFSNLQGAIIEAPSLEVIENELMHLDDHSLVVFDIDYTLIVPDDLILKPCGEAYFQKRMTQLRSMGDHGAVLSSIISLQSKVSIIDDQIFDILKFLKQNHIKTIALSAMPTGKYGIIPNAEDWRINQLHVLGIDFDWAFPNLDAIELPGFKGKRTSPAFKKGILASAKNPKGKVLVSFLKQINWTPAKIIFVDDRMEFINSIETELNKANIPHLCFHYTAASDNACKLDEDLADFQIDYLIKVGQWLSDNKAKELSAISNYFTPAPLKKRKAERK